MCGVGNKIVCFSVCVLLPQPVLSAVKREEEEAQSECIC